MPCTSLTCYIRICSSLTDKDTVFTVPAEAVSSAECSLCTCCSESSSCALAVTQSIDEAVRALY